MGFSPCWVELAGSWPSPGLKLQSAVLCQEIWLTPPLFYNLLYRVQTHHLLLTSEQTGQVLHPPGLAWDAPAQGSRQVSWLRDPVPCRVLAKMLASWLLLSLVFSPLI